jgi:hypothetical protein
VYGGRIGSSYQQQGLALSKQFKREQQILSAPGAAMGAGAKDGSAENEDEDQRRVRDFGFAEMRAAEGVSAKGREE